MKKYWFFYLLLLLPAILIAQTPKETPGYTNGRGGLEYKIYIDKGGPKLEVGDFVSINVLVKMDSDSVLFNTSEAGQPLQTIVPKPEFNGDIFEGLTNLSEGDSAVLKVNADTMFKMQAKPKGLKGTYLIYYVRIDKVIKKGATSSEEFGVKIADYEQVRMRKLKTAEPGLINKYPPV